MALRVFLVLDSMAYIPINKIGLFYSTQLITGLIKAGFNNRISDLSDPKRYSPFFLDHFPEIYL